MVKISWLLCFFFWLVGFRNDILGSDYAIVMQFLQICIPYNCGKTLEWEGFVVFCVHFLEMHVSYGKTNK